MVWKKRVRIIGLARCKFLSEPLEPRTMLSLSGTILSGPQTAVGNMWTYSYVGLDEIDTVGIVGTTTENGQPAVERDTSSYANGLSGGVGSVQKDYLQANSAGLVDYNQTNTNYNTTGGVQSTTSHLFEPAEVIIPATLEVGQPVTVTTVDTFTVTDFTNNDMNATVTRNISNTGTLVSDTPAPLTVPAGTFSCYQVQQTLVWTQDSGTTTINETVYLAVGVGIVEINETDTTDNGNGGGGSGSSVKVLDSFTGGDRLVFNPQQPPNVQAGDPIQPSFTVSVEDSTGDVETDATGTVTLTPSGVNADNPITGNTAPLVGGVATFSSVVLTEAGVYQLNATDTNDDAMATSLKFGVGGDKLVFSVQPENIAADELFAVTVKAVTPKGVVDDQLADSVVLSLNQVSGGNGQASLGATVQEGLVRGVAAFGKTISLGDPGTYTLTATADTGYGGVGVLSTDYQVTAGISDPFIVTGLHLKFVKSPTDTDAGDSIPFSVELLNTRNHLVTTGDSASDSLTLSLTPEATLTEGALSLAGGKFVSSDAAGLTTDEPGRYTLTVDADPAAGDPPVTAFTSSEFIVLGYHLHFSKAPSTTDLGQAIPFTVVLYDSKNKRVSDADIPQTEDGLSIELTKSDDSVQTFGSVLDGGAYSSGAPANTDNGVVANNGAGNFKLSVDATSLDESGVEGIDTTVAGVTSGSFQITGFHLKFSPQPADADAGDVLHFTIRLLDSHNQPVTDTASDDDALALASNSAGSNHTPKTLTVALDGGVYAAGNTPDGLSISGPGTYTISAQAQNAGGDDPDVTAATSSSFKVSALHLHFSTPPANLTVGQPLTFAVNLLDTHNTVNTDVTSAGDSITFDLVDSAGATQTFTGNTLQAGVLSFSIPTTSIAAGTYRITASALSQTDGLADPAVEPVTSLKFTIKST